MAQRTTARFPSAFQTVGDRPSSQAVTGCDAETETLLAAAQTALHLSRLSDPYSTASRKVGPMPSMRVSQWKHSE